MVVRAHREKLGDVRVAEGEAVGRWLGVVSRAVVGAVKGDERDGEVGYGGDGEDADVGDWNVVQNNGERPITGVMGRSERTETRLLTSRFCRRTRGSGRAPCPFPYHTSRRRCPRGEGEELDCVWERAEGGVG